MELQVYCVAQSSSSATVLIVVHGFGKEDTEIDDVEMEQGQHAFYENKQNDIKSEVGF
jgi:hypothetical protein